MKFLFFFSKHCVSYPKFFRNVSQTSGCQKVNGARILINFANRYPFVNSFFFPFFFYRCTIFVFNLNVSAAKYAATIFSTTFQLSILGNFERRFEFRTKASRIRSTSADAIFKTTPENSDGLCSPPLAVNLPLHLHLKPVRVARRARTLLQSCPVGMHPLYSFLFFSSCCKWGCIEGGHSRMD